MMYCFSTEQGSFYGDAQYAKEIGKFIFYDEKKDEFTDKDGNIVDVMGMEILPRTGVLQATALIEALDRHGAKSIVKMGDYEQTLAWPKYIETKRRNVLMSGKEILDNMESIIEMFGPGEIFFKTKNKNYSQIIDIARLVDPNDALHQALMVHLNDDFIISDVVDIVRDKYGPLEYRGFVVDGELFNVSRISDFLMCGVPKDCIKRMKEVIEEAKKTGFQKTFVVDLFYYKDSSGNISLDVLECNPLIASGTYLYNSVFSKSCDLEHSDVKKIPIEKMKYGRSNMYSEDIVVKSCPSICYELPGGFAADVVSYMMFGRASNGMFMHFDFSENVSPLNIGMISMDDVGEHVLSSDSDFGVQSDDDAETLVERQLIKKFLEENKPVEE